MSVYAAGRPTDEQTEVLRKALLPEIKDNKYDSGHIELRIWSGLGHMLLQLCTALRIGILRYIFYLNKNIIARAVILFL